MDEKVLKAKKEKMKYEIASELNLLDKVNQSGWKSLTAKESGRIGGLMTKRMREERKSKEEDESG